MVFQFINDQISTIFQYINCVSECDNTFNRAGRQVVVQLGWVCERDLFLLLEFQMNGHLLSDLIKYKRFDCRVEKLDDF